MLPNPPVLFTTPRFDWPCGRFVGVRMGPHRKRKAARDTIRHFPQDVSGTRTPSRCISTRRANFLPAGGHAASSSTNSLNKTISIQKFRSILSGEIPIVFLIFLLFLPHIPSSIVILAFCVITGAQIRNYTTARTGFAGEQATSSFWRYPIDLLLIYTTELHCSQRLFLPSL